MIVLANLTDLRVGGIPSYLSHLARALAGCGQAAMIVRPAARTEPEPRPFLDGLVYRNVAEGDLVALAADARRPVVIGGMYWRRYGALGERLLAAGAAAVVHDPQDAAGDYRDALVRYGTRTVAIRRGMAAWLRGQGIRATFVPHPYLPAARPATRTEHAVCLARIDWDKHTDLILEANALLPAERAVRLASAALNRIYAYQRLRAVDPDWERWRATDRGRGPVARAAGARFVVDMSLIAGDGGGTQYTFLEAWDAGATLVVHRGWLRPGDALEEGRNCLAAETAGELVGALGTDWGATAPLRSAGRAQLAEHAPGSVATAFLAATGAGRCECS